METFLTRRGPRRVRVVDSSDEEDEKEARSRLSRTRDMATMYHQGCKLHEYTPCRLDSMQQMFSTIAKFREDHHSSSRLVKSTQLGLFTDMKHSDLNSGNKFVSSHFFVPALLWQVWSWAAALVMHNSGWVGVSTIVLWVVGCCGGLVFASVPICCRLCCSNLRARHDLGNIPSFRKNNKV